MVTVVRNVLGVVIILSEGALDRTGLMEQSYSYAERPMTDDTVRVRE